MTTWHHYPLSHPWMASRKRKLSDSPDDSDHDNIAPQPFAPRTLPHSKRRRFDLARNLSRLSLFEQAQAHAPIVEEQAVKTPQPLPTSDQDVDISPWSPSHLQGQSADAVMDTDGDMAVQVIAHPIVEEPPERAIGIREVREVRMRNTSSYEPEKDRIIVTNLDSSDDESETSPETFAGNDNVYSVSPAFLSRIKTSTPLSKTLPPKPESDSQALVLFKPSPWSAKDARELELIYRARDADNSSNDEAKPQIETPDADAMEIE
ncbi:hypothetical protein JB92DRAFT_2992101 [Gautieria morchelliformis]|nr:hypothetical protein JB92DRAFT_2992101 [Gautieria morchelliformis]